MYLYSLIATLFIFSLPASAAGDHNEDVCIELGFSADCWAKIESPHCKDSKQKKSCFPDQEPWTDVIRPIVETENNELCELLSTKPGRDSAVIEADRIFRTYKDTLPRIVARATVVYPCGNETCGEEINIQTNLNKLAHSAPDLFIWGNALACGHIRKMDARLYFNQPLAAMPYEPGDPIEVVQERLEGLHRRMCASLKTLEQRKQMTERQMYRRFESVLTGLVKIDFTVQRNGKTTHDSVGGDIPVIEAQTLACGWYAHDRTSVSIGGGLRKRLILD